MEAGAEWRLSYMARTTITGRSSRNHILPGMAVRRQAPQPPQAEADSVKAVREEPAARPFQRKHLLQTLHGAVDAADGHRRAAEAHAQKIRGAGGKEDWQRRRTISPLMSNPKIEVKRRKEGAPAE